MTNTKSTHTVLDHAQAVPSVTDGSASAPDPMSRSRIWLIVGGGVILAIAGLLFWRLLPKHQPATYTGRIETLHIGNVGEYSIFNLVAKEKGFFRQHGIEAIITEYASGPPGVTDLLAGKEDVAVAGDFVGVTNMFKHQDLKILSQVSQQQVFQVIARKDKGIARPADLKGKKIGVTKKSSGEFFLGRFATLNDLSLSDINIVDLPPAALVSGLTDGTLDAVVTFEPHAYNLKKALGDQIITWSAQGDEATLALLYSTDAFVGAHPDLAKRYIAALVEAEDFVTAHPAEAQAIVAHALHYDPAYVTYLWGKIDFALRLEQKLLLTLEDQAHFAIENKLTDQPTVPNYLDFIYFPALESVSPKAVTIIH